MAITRTVAAAQDAPRIIVPDAKHRIDQGLNDTLTPNHAYRDTHSRAAGPANIERVARAASHLTPQVPELGTAYEDTTPPGRLFHPAYRERFRFGAVMLRRGMSVGDIAGALRTVLTDATA